MVPGIIARRLVARFVWPFIDLDRRYFVIAGHRGLVRIRSDLRANVFRTFRKFQIRRVRFGQGRFWVHGRGRPAPIEAVSPVLADLRAIRQHRLYVPAEREAAARAALAEIDPA